MMKTGKHHDDFRENSVIKNNSVNTNDELISSENDLLILLEDYDREMQQYSQQEFTSGGRIDDSVEEQG